MTEICFVNFHDGSQRSGVEDAKMVRQHIHRAVLRDRGHRNIQSKVRHFTGAKFVTSLVKMEQQAIARRPNRDRPVRKKEHPKPLQEYFCEPSQPPSPTSLDQGNRHKISLHTLPAVPGAQISTYHPYTRHVASAVPLSVKRLDSLLKSRTWWGWTDLSYLMNLSEQMAQASFGSPPSHSSTPVAQIRHPAWTWCSRVASNAPPF